MSRKSTSKEKKKEEIKEINKKLYSLNRRLNNVKEKYLVGEFDEREYVSLSIVLEDGIEELNCRKNGLNKVKLGKGYDDCVTKVEKKEYA